MDGLLALPLPALCLGALWLALLLVLLFAWLLACRPVRWLDEAIAGRGPLWRGPAFVGGEVELAPEEPVPLEVKIIQRGTEKDVYFSMPGNVRDVRKTFHVRWETLREEVVARPFFVRRADGERIRVEPPREVKFRGLMDVRIEEVPRLDRYEARLRPGDKVFIVGTLERIEPSFVLDPAQKDRGGYRAPAPRDVVEAAWVLGPPEGQPMVIERQPFRRPFPGAEARRRMRARGLGFWAVAAIGVLAQLVLRLPLVEWAYDLFAVAGGALLLLAAAIAFEKPPFAESEDAIAAAETNPPAAKRLPAPPPPSDPGALPGAGSKKGLGTGVDENGDPYGLIG